MSTRSRRSDAGQVKMTERDLRLLRIVAEQYAVTVPQLATLMGRSHHAARWLRERWQAAGWVEGRAVLVGRPVFLWPTRRGLRACPTPPSSTRSRNQRPSCALQGRRSQSRRVSSTTGAARSTSAPRGSSASTRSRRMRSGSCRLACASRWLGQGAEGPGGADAGPTTGASKSAW